MHEVEALLALMASLPLVWGLLALAAAAMLEYVFPPFPGDAVVLVGALLIPLAGWPFGAVLGAVTAGSVVGAWLTWSLGRALGQASGPAWLRRWLERPGVWPRVRALEARFERHGSLYVALNRFLPGFRAFFFLIAGKVGLPLWRVLLLGAVSAALWSLALLGAGWAVGFHLERLVELSRAYSTIIWSLLAVAALVWALRRTWRAPRAE